MLSIYICEDNIVEQKFIEDHVKRFLMIEEFDMKFEFSTTKPDEVLDHILQKPQCIGLYFLDIGLNSNMNGIQLAAKIRLLDPVGNIVFITTHSELVMMAFKYKIEALDFILKDTLENIGEKICECMKVANLRHMKQAKKRDSFIDIHIGHQVRSLNVNEINFFETSSTPHKLIVHLINSQIDFYGTIKDMVVKLNHLSHFISVHQSFLVNINNVEHVDNRTRKITFFNGDFCFASHRGLKKLKYEKNVDE